jgi:1,4-alpha-glucan branching enzyme
MAVKTGVVKPTANKNQSNLFENKVLDKTLTFEFLAPEAATVGVAGSFNNWSADSFVLKKGKDGVWKGQLNLKPGRYEYRFLVDARWENKPGVQYASNNFGSTNCVLEVK